MNAAMAPAVPRGALGLKPTRRPISNCPLASRARRCSVSVVAGPPRDVSTSAVAAPVALDTVTISPSPRETRVQQLDPGSFLDFIKDSADDLVVVDWYTDWCGPCQLMHKELEKLTSALPRVKFAKLNCGECQEFSTQQRIRALPTFRVYYKGTCLDEVTGAKPTQLRQMLTHYSVMATI